MPDVLDVNSPVEGRGLVLAFGEVVALAESDFHFPPAAVTALIGPNGSGKSSIFGAVAGLHRPRSGALSVLGGGPEAVRKRVAFVPQSTKVNDVLPVTVREVVGMGRYASLGLVRPFRQPDRAAVDAALERLNLGDLAARHLWELSGGQRQRVFVGQGLVQEHDLLLLDEPTTGLDLPSIQVIDEVISEERAAGRPVAVTTHDFGEARRADHVILLANRVVAEGPPDEVLTPPHLAAAYGFDAADLGGHVDDAAHDPAQVRHRHVEYPPI